MCVILLNQDNWKHSFVHHFNALIKLIKFWVDFNYFWVVCNFPTAISKELHHHLFLDFILYY